MSGARPHLQDLLRHVVPLAAVVHHRFVIIHMLATRGSPAELRAARELRWLRAADSRSLYRLTRRYRRAGVACVRAGHDTVSRGGCSRPLRALARPTAPVRRLDSTTRRRGRRCGVRVRFRGARSVVLQPCRAAGWMIELTGAASPCSLLPPRLAQTGPHFRLKGRQGETHRRCTHNFVRSTTGARAAGGPLGGPPHLLDARQLPRQL